MGMAGQRSYNTPNPGNFNYPKLMHLKGNQYKNYPKFKEMGKKEDQKENKNETANLAKELEKQIKELQKLTKEAKELAKKKAMSESKSAELMNTNNKTSGKIINNKDNTNSTEQAFSNLKKLRKSNLDKVNFYFLIFF